jgi:exopolyphosphatase / guanosine-5'-triphosphate,3'-diphosphate pyrophosphatase
VILAAIDIGSNAARLLINEISPYKDGTVDFNKLNLVRIPLRLGLDVFDIGAISNGRKEKLIGTLHAYKTLMKVYDVEDFKACATSAMRSASNSAEILQEIEEETGIKVQMITGSEEANIIYETHFAEKLNKAKSYLYIDVGGGSTEVTLFAQNRIVFKESFEIGTIRVLRNQIGEEQWNHFRTFIKDNCKDYLPIEAIGTGGNINKVFSMSKKKDGKPLSIDFLKDYYKKLSTATLEERKHVYLLRDDRADVIVPALFIYLLVMRSAGTDEIYVPKIGLADGLIKMLYREKTEKQIASLSVG